MIIGRMKAQEWDKVKTKEELQEILKQYKRVLTSPMIEYLNSLIELEFSVLRKYIDESDRQVLADLEIFKRIAIYNIYNRAISISERVDEKSIITGNANGIEGLYISSLIDGRHIDLFRYDYHDKLLDDNKLKQYRTSNLGNIELFQTLESEEARKAEIERIKGKQLNMLFDQEFNDLVYYKNYRAYPRRDTKEESIYEKQIRELERPLSETDKSEIELTKQFNDLILEDYGISFENFMEDLFNFGINADSTKLEKTFVKKMPNLTIKENIKFY